MSQQQNKQLNIFGIITVNFVNIVTFVGHLSSVCMLQQGAKSLGIASLLATQLLAGMLGRNNLQKTDMDSQTAWILTKTDLFSLES